MSATSTESSVVEAASDAPPENIKKRVWELALPAIGENLLHTALLIVDTAMIAPFGTVPLAASAVAGVLLWRSHMTFGCIERGTTALVARFSGENQPDKVAKTVAQSINLAILIGLVMTIGGYAFAGWLLRSMGAATDVEQAGAPFLRIIALASIPRLVFYVVSASMRGTGDTRTPMWISLWMNVTNVAFNYVFIYGIPGVMQGRGLTGSAISTALSITIATAVLTAIAAKGSTYYRLRLHHFRTDWGLIGRILRISWPSLLEELILTVGFVAFYRFITVLGTDTVAAHTVATRVESLSFMAGLGFAVAAATLVGQSLGQKNVERARTCFRISAQSSVKVMLAIGCGLVIFGGYITNAFIYDNPKVAEMARMLILIAALEQPLLGFCAAIGGGLRGAGDTFHPMLNSLVGGVIVRVAACYILAFPLGWGIYGIYWGTVIDWAVRAAVLYWFYRRGAWSRIQI